MPENADSRPNSPGANGGAPEGSQLTLRALVTTKEAGIIIGKAGKNVADLRDRTGVKAGVSKVVPGVHERVLSISGAVEGIAKAYSLIISQLLEPDPSTSSSGQTIVPPSHTSLRLLISHNLMGTIIGRQGLKIKAIQDASGARMIASKDMLPQSTERVVEVQGTAEGIGRAVEEIGRCLLEDWERGLGTVLYHPGAEGSAARGSEGKRGLPASASGNSTHSANGTSGSRRTGGGSGPKTNGNAQSAASPSSPTPASPPNGARASNSASTLPTSNSANTTKSGPPNPEIRTQNISIPSDMVGCIIGRGGTKITEIRRLSGSKISIAKTPHDDTGERMFTIVGTSEANEKALFLLYNQLESEKERRVGKEIAAGGEGAAES